MPTIVDLIDSPPAAIQPRAAAAFCYRHETLCSGDGPDAMTELYRNAQWAVSLEWTSLRTESEKRNFVRWLEVALRKAQQKLMEDGIETMRASLAAEAAERASRPARKAQDALQASLDEIISF